MYKFLGDYPLATIQIASRVQQIYEDELENERIHGSSLLLDLAEPYLPDQVLLDHVFDNLKVKQSTADPDLGLFQVELLLMLGCSPPAEN